MRKSVHIFTILSLIIAGCSLNKKTLPNMEFNESKNQWEEEYKRIAFNRCLFLGLNKGEEVRNVLKLDRSTHNDFAFGLYHYKRIDSIVQPAILRAKQDSIDFYDQHLKGMNDVERNELNGLPIIKYCLNFYKSDELDSIATHSVNQMRWLWDKEYNPYENK